MDGDLSPEEFQEAWDYNMNAVSEIHDLMKQAIADKYGGGQ
jgi:hypothetical protein